MKKVDVLVVGELNVDLILNSIRSFPQIGKETIAGDMNLTLGSSSAIFASNLSSLGVGVGMIGIVGKDLFGDMVLEKLKMANVDTSRVNQKKTAKTGATIAMNFGEDRAMVTYMGAMEELRLEDVPFEMLEGARHLHFSSYFLQTGIQKDLVKLFQMARNAGLTTSFDAQWDPSEKWELDLNTLFPVLDVFFPNEKELVKLGGFPDPRTAVDTLINTDTITAIKRGNKGSILIHKGKKTEMPAFLNKEIVDAIGAGDSFNAGFIAKYLQNAPLDQCQEFGNLIGAISTTAAGGTGAFQNMGEVKKIAREKFGFGESGFNR